MQNTFISFSPLETGDTGEWVGDMLVWTGRLDNMLKVTFHLMIYLFNTTCVALIEEWLNDVIPTSCRLFSEITHWTLRYSMLVNFSC